MSVKHKRYPVDISSAELVNKIRKKLNLKIILIPVAIAALILIGCFLVEINEDKCTVFGNIIQGMDKVLKDSQDLLLTMDTILAAVIVFFYGIMDNRKHGIPQRTILSYTFGPFTIPIFFLLDLVMLPVIYIGQSSFRSLTLMGLILCTYFIQALIIIMILLSTSFKYSANAVCNTEIRQFGYLRHCRITDKEYLWTYILHHMEEVVAGEELTADKMYMFRKLLGVPFYERERLFVDNKMRIALKYDEKDATHTGNRDDGAPENNNGKKRNRLKQRKDADNNDIVQTVYEFYYANLISVFGHLCDDRDGRDKLYLCLYELCSV
ncbi:MAG: hypothetical protein LUC91_05815 [Prevotella sp.]|nr:hypothetical protein [Prevotella sp.]